MQVVYNIFDQAPEDELFPVCEAQGVGVIARVPFDEGSLTGTLSRESRWPSSDWRNLYFTAENLATTLEHVERLLPLVPAGMDLPGLALRFILHHPAVTTTDPGHAQAGARGAQPRRQRRSVVSSRSARGPARAPVGSDGGNSLTSELQKILRPSKPARRRSGEPLYANTCCACVSLSRTATPYAHLKEQALQSLHRSTRTCAGSLQEPFPCQGELAVAVGVGQEAQHVRNRTPLPRTRRHRLRTCGSTSG